MLKAISKKRQGYFKQISEVGSGTYGKVYKVEVLDEDKKILAFKKITYTKDNEGFPQTALREIRILQSLSHKNVIRLHKIITSKPSENNKYRGSTFLVFDYMEHDLLGLIKHNAVFTPPQLKCIMKQILEGVRYIHSRKVIHRDLKCANILVSGKGEVKIADFGLARYLTQGGNYTNCVVTLWYRAPELLLGQKKYTTKIDMWSVGCVMAELILGQPLFTGDKEVRQCEYIFQACGTPDETNWPTCKSLPHYNTFVPSVSYPRKLKEHLHHYKPFLDDATLDFIDKLLVLNPEKRMDADEALAHRYFKEDPQPCEIGDMPEFKSECHITLIKNEKMRSEKEKTRKAQEERDKERRTNQPPPKNMNMNNSNSNSNSSSKRRYGETFDSYPQQQQQQQQQPPPHIPTSMKYPPPMIPQMKPHPPSGDPFKPLPPQQENPNMNASKSNILLPQTSVSMENNFSMVSRPMSQVWQHTMQMDIKSEFSPTHNDDSHGLSSLVSRSNEKDNRNKNNELLELLKTNPIKKKQATGGNAHAPPPGNPISRFDEHEKIIKKQHQ